MAILLCSHTSMFSSACNICPVGKNECRNSLLESFFVLTNNKQVVRTANVNTSFTWH